MNDIVPDYMTALVGYRAWNLTPEGYLLSINSDIGEPWPCKEKKRATCTMIGESYAPGMVLSSSSYVPVVVAGTFEHVWEKRRRARAARHHNAPMPDCSCGIYAAKSDKSSHYSGYAHCASVWGEVYLWGKIQEYTEGYRAEFAYPKSLKTSNPTLAPKIAERYGVSCEAVEPKKRLVVYDDQPGTVVASIFQQILQSVGAIGVINRRMP